MTEGFIRSPRGYLARPDASVRFMIARAAEELGDILNRPLELVPEANSDDDILASLDFDIAETIEDCAADPALARLLPPMSRHDPALADELRLASHRRIRNAKARQLRILHDILVSGSDPYRNEAPSDDPSRDGRFGGDDVVVPYEVAHAVASALTDIRLLIAERLDIDATGVAAPPSVVRDGADRARTVLAELYTFLTWWQDSLLRAMGGNSASP